MFRLNQILIRIAYLLFMLIFITACGQQTEQPKTTSGKKIGVLIVNHGSHSKTWRNMLWDVEKQVKDTILKNKRITEVRTAFMEYTEPSIATQMKAFDAEGFDEVVVVPLFLTVSSHYSHDIPVILGVSSDPKAKKTMEGKENIEVYKSKARVSITPPLDYTTILKKNIARRVKALSKNGENEGVLLVAYGDKMYNQQWEEMVEEIGNYLQVKTGHESIAYSWCGHLVKYSTQPTIDGIEALFKLEDNVIVIPVLVANDSYFQNDIIQKAVDSVEDSDHVFYKQDAILPDANLNSWIVDIVNKTLEQI